jgi:fructokinase
VAVAIARLGGDVGFFGRVGQDPLGRFMKQTLADENVDVDALCFDENARTSTVLVDLDASGERSFTFMVKPSADQFTQQVDIPEFKAGEWLHCCSIALANEPSRSATLESMRRIKAAGGFVSFDPNLRDEVWPDPQEIQPVVMQAVALADVVKFSDDELMFLTSTDSLEKGLEALNGLNNTLVLVTQGAKGALVVFEGEQRLITGTPTKPVDTTGAGDAFVGGLLGNLARQQQWALKDRVTQAVQWANGCGALATTQKGAMTALPTEQALLDSL